MQKYEKLEKIGEGNILLTLLLFEAEGQFCQELFLKMYLS